MAASARYRGNKMDFMDTFLSFVKRRLISAALVLGAILTFLAALYVWWMAYPEVVLPALEARQGDMSVPGGLQSRWTYALGQALRAFVFSDVYADYTDEHFTPHIEIIGLAGSVIALGAIIRAAFALFVRPIERIRASWRSGHVVVLGGREVAIGAAEAIEMDGSVTYHGENAHLAETHVLTVPRPMQIDAPFLKSSIKRSARVIVAEKDDIQTLETVLGIGQYLDDEIVFAVFDNPWISIEGMNLSSYGGAQTQSGYIVSRSVVRATARTAILPVPPFLLAQQQDQSRIHVLFVGFNALTVTMIEEILIANIMPGQKLPRFTILTEGAFKAEQAFNARHGGLTEESRRSDIGPIDIQFIENVYDGITEMAAESLVPLVKAEPLTAVYVTLAQSEEPLAAAVAIQTASVKRNLFACPIFVNSPHGVGMRKALWEDAFTSRGLYAFGGLDDLIKALGLLEDEPDKLAKAYDASYRKVLFDDESEENAWKNMTDMFRRANQNAVLHLPAKLAAMGFDIRPYLLQHDVLSPSTAPKLTPDTQLVLSPDSREVLAEMEHERWMVERWVSGWRFGKRDNQHLRHNNLTPYSQLEESIKDYDRMFVDWVETWLERSDKEGIARL